MNRSGSELSCTGAEQLLKLQRDKGRHIGDVFSLIKQPRASSGGPVGLSYSRQ